MHSSSCQRRAQESAREQQYTPLGATLHCRVSSYQHGAVAWPRGGDARGDGVRGVRFTNFAKSVIQISQKALPFFGYESVTAFRQAPSSQNMVYEAFLYYLPTNGKNSLPTSGYEFVTEKRQAFSWISICGLPKHGYGLVTERRETWLCTSADRPRRTASREGPPAGPVRPARSAANAIRRAP